jgi:hypothetical protein
MSKCARNLWLMLGLSIGSMQPAVAQDKQGLWSVYETALKRAKYIDLTQGIRSLRLVEGVAEPRVGNTQAFPRGRARSTEVSAPGTSRFVPWS